MSHPRHARPKTRLCPAVLLAAATILAGSSYGHAETLAAAPGPSPAGTVARPASPSTDLDRRFARFLAGFRPEALAAGISVRTFDRALSSLTLDSTILDLLVAQPEHTFAPWEYVGRLVSAKRIVEGHQKLTEHIATFADVEARHGVDRHVVAAIWGIESSYGASPGSRDVVRSLATLAVSDPRRPAFWRKELVAALTILDRGDVPPDRMIGSWAGAMGHTQFMPTSYLTHAVDHDGDGRRDIWGSVPDAIASTAAYLRRSGWRPGEPWGLEVILPAGFDFAANGPRTTRSAAEWQAIGVSPPPGSDWPATLPGSSLLLPTGRHGPAFLLAPNFEVILKYNNATLYALAVGHLSDRLAGRPPLAALWPLDDAPLDRAGRIVLQERLAALGFDVGPIDGVIGETTRNVIRTWQRKQGLPADGWAGARLMEMLGAATEPPR